MKISQCCSCGKDFEIDSEEVLFCSSSCKKEHDIFTLDKDKLVMNYFLELDNNLKEKNCQATATPGKKRQLTP
jgi:hypothetical protein